LADVYCDASEYYVESTTRMDEAGQTHITHSVTAAARDRRFRHDETDKGGRSLLIVSDGREEWAVYPDQKQFSVSALGGSYSGGRFANVQEHLCSLSESSVRRIRWLRREQVASQGRLRPCAVVEVATGHSCWIDTEDHKILREEQEFRNGRRWVSEYLDARMKEPPPDTLFLPPVTAGLTQVQPVVSGVSLTATWKARYEDAKRELAAGRDELTRSYVLTRLAKAAFEVGRMGEAEQSAREVLRLAARFETDWNYGNAIHDGHMVLGRIALRNDDLRGARRELLEAGKTRGSPQLDTFGPNMSLAKELLDRGELDTVREYLQECGSFWEKKETLGRWGAAIANGEVPDFGLNLRP
jgi:outer membrane lipoprotein-sorting protein